MIAVVVMRLPADGGPSVSPHCHQRLRSLRCFVDDAIGRLGREVDLHRCDLRFLVQAGNDAGMQLHDDVIHNRRDILRQVIKTNLAQGCIPMQHGFPLQKSRARGNFGASPPRIDRLPVTPAFGRLLNISDASEQVVVAAAAYRWQTPGWN